MDNPLVIAGIIAGAVVVTLLVVWLGFNIPARRLLPELGDAAEVEWIDLPVNTPVPLRRCLSAAYGEKIPLPRSVVAHGRGKFRIRKLPGLGFIWAPVAWTLHLAPGQEFVWRMRVYWFRRLIVDGGDEYRDGRGQFMFGHKPVVSEHLDRSELTAMWLYTLFLAPSVLLDWPGVTFESGEDEAVRVQIPTQGETLEFTLRFDHASGALTRVETMRPASKDGRLFPFEIVLSSIREWEPGLALPSQLRAAWEGDFYNRYDVEGVHYNAPVEKVLQEGVE